MCQAIAKPADARIFRRTLAMAYAQNPDGAGFAWYDEESEMVWESKGYFNFKKFWEAYRKHEHQNVLIHFRAATHGAINADNCHPFRLADNVVMAHNGVLYSYTPLGKDERSDSRIFVEELLEPVITQAIDPVKFINTPQTLKLIRELVGGWNKLVFLTPQGFAFVNQGQGDWIKGVWFSAGNPEHKWAQQGPIWEDEDGVVGRAGKRHRSAGSYFGNPHPFGTKEYDQWYLDRGYERNAHGAGWILKRNKVAVYDENLPSCPHCQWKYHHGDDCASGKRGAEITEVERKRWTTPVTTGGAAPEDEGEGEGMGPVNGSRPRNPQAAQESLQLAVGTSQGDAPTAEDAPIHGWQAWMEAQSDLDATNKAQDLEDQLEIIDHNRKALTMAMADLPEGSQLHGRLMQGMRDLDERERLAVELAQGGM